MLIWPWRVEVVAYHSPRVNWAMIAVTLLLHAMAVADLLPVAVRAGLVLDGWGLGLAGHMLGHGGWMHLAGNMWMLWVFGNAVAQMIGGVRHLGFYLLFGLVAAAVHVACFEGSVVGASGAVFGVIGLACVLCPKARVRMGWWFILRAGTFALPLWGLAVIWAGFDLLRWRFGGVAVAHDMHMTGLLAGALAGFAIRERVLREKRCAAASAEVLDEPSC